MTATHHSNPRFRSASKAIRAAANANPLAVCTCGLTLDQHGHGGNNKPQRWTAGHTRSGSNDWEVWTRITVPPPPGDWLTPQTSRCNGRLAAQQTNDKKLGFDVGL